MTTPIAGLPEISESQASKAITHNMALRQLEINFGAVISRSLTAPPSSPAEGSLYIPASGASGAWSGHTNKIVQWANGGWNIYPSFQYQRIFSVADNSLIQYDGSAWAVFSFEAQAISGNPSDNTIYGKQDGNKGFFDALSWVLTGLSQATGGAISATDSILQAFGKIQNQIADRARITALNNFTIQQRFPLATLTDGATINWNLNTQQVASVTLAGNRTLAAPTNIQSGGTYILIVRQDGTGNRTLTFNSVYRFPSAPTLSTAVNAIDVFSFVSDGTSLFGSLSRGYS